MLILSILVKVGGSTVGKEVHGFARDTLVVHPLLRVGALIRKQSKFLTFNHNDECQEKTTDHTARKGS